MNNRSIESFQLAMAGNQQMANLRGTKMAICRALFFARFITVFRFVAWPSIVCWLGVLLALVGVPLNTGWGEKGWKGREIDGSVIWFG